jgi:hypothetical protein
MSARLFQNVDALRKTGQLSISTTALPATQIVASAGGDSPTYTVTTVVNDNAIDLSGVAVGDVIVTNDGYKGLVKSIDDGANTLTLDNDHAWLDPAGGQGRLGGTIKPTDGQSFSVQRISLVQYITIGSDSGNSDVVYVGRDGNARTTDYPLQPGETLPINDLNFVDVTQIYVIAASGTQTINWILGAPGGAGNYAAVIAPGASWAGAVTYTTFADGDTTPDVSATIGFKTGNTGATTITDFDGATNKFIIIVAEDDNTTIQSNANIILNAGSDLKLETNDVVTFLHDGSTWNMLSYAQNTP